jgi:hypothetical protein
VWRPKLDDFQHCRRQARLEDDYSRLLCRQHYNMHKRIQRLALEHAGKASRVS